MGKFLSFIGLEDVDDDEIFEEEEEKKPKAAPPRAKQRKESSVKAAGSDASMQSVADMKMIVFHPVSYDGNVHSQ